MNDKSALAKETMLELLSGVLLIKQNDDCLEKTIACPNSVIIWGCMSGQEPGDMVIITLTVNEREYMEILDI